MQDSIAKEKSGVKKCLEICAIKGGGVRRLMANAILNFHFDFPHPSLITFVLFFCCCFTLFFLPPPRLSGSVQLIFCFSSLFLLPSRLSGSVHQSLSFCTIFSYQFNKVYLTTFCIFLQNADMRFFCHLVDSSDKTCSNNIGIRNKPFEIQIQ